MRSKLILNGLGTVLWSTSSVLALTPYGNGIPPPAPVPSACDSTPPQPSPATGNSTTTTNVDYEYIVVGSGPGGGPLAARLAIAGFKVLLIEAGDDQGETLQEKTPLLWLLASEYDPMKWSYFVNHYPTLEQQQQDSKFTWESPTGDYYNGPNPPNGSKPLGVLYPRAGTLGGCAAHNALKTVLPHDSDWANIASLTNDSSWEPHHMKKYFEKLEDNQYILPGASTRGHGKKGWLGTSLMDLSFMAADNKLTSAVSAAANAFGVKGISRVLNTASALKTVFVKDVNGPYQQVNNEGIYQQPLAVSNGFRSGPRNFLIDTASAVNADGSRKYHLDIRLNTFVTSVRFDKTGATPRAIGVNFLDGRGLYRATPKSVLGSPTGTGSINASREVIISAGAYNTPQLLKLSGVGPKEELATFNIPLILDAPGVGSNLQDRYETSVVTKSPSPYELLHGCTLMNTNPDECLVQWQNGSTIQERGVYTTNGFAFAMIRKSSVAEENPDLYLYGAPVSFTGFFPGYTTLPYLIPNATTTGWYSWIVLKAHARNNAGTVTLRSADPLDTPIINFNTFETGTQGSDNSSSSAWQKDLQAFYEGVQFARSVNKELQAIEPNCFEEVFPGEAIQEEQDVKEFIKKESFGHHASCSCPIGADGDKMAVLDGKFRVRGTEGLRVVDASVFPKIPGFFPSLPTYMVSEKAADVIIQDSAAASSIKST